MTNKKLTDICDIKVIAENYISYFKLYCDIVIYSVFTIVFAIVPLLSIVVSAIVGHTWYFFASLLAFAFVFSSLALWLYVLLWLKYGHQHCFLSSTDLVITSKIGNFTVRKKQIKIGDIVKICASNMKFKDYYVFTDFGIFSELYTYHLRGGKIKVEYVKNNKTCTFYFCHNSDEETDMYLTKIKSALESIIVLN